MTEGFFEFGTNIGEVAAQIDRGLAGISEALNGRGLSSTSLNIASGLQSQFASIGAKYAELTAQMGRETQQAIAKGLSPATYQQQIAQLGARLRAELGEAVGGASRQLSASGGGGAFDLRGFAQQLNAELSRGLATFSRESVLPGVRQMATAASPDVPAGQVTSRYLGATGQAAMEKSLSMSTVQINKLTSDAAALNAQFVAFADRLRAATAGSVLAPAELSALQLGARGQGALAGSVNEAGGGYVFNNRGEQQVISGTGVLQAKGTQAYNTAMEALANQAEEQLAVGASSLTAQEATAQAQRRLATATNEQAIKAEAAAKNAPGGGGEPPRSLRNAFAGGFFGRGWESNQAFDPKMAINNLAGTAGVLARYGGEGRLLYGAAGAVGDSFKGLEQYQEAQVSLQEALGETNTKQVDLNGAITAGAQAGLGAADSINVGAQALKSYGDYVHSSADATAILTTSVEQAGQAAILTGQQVEQAQQQLITATFGFNTGPQGQAQINDAVVNAARNFGGNRSDILQATSGAAADASEAGLTPEMTANMAALIQRDTGSTGSALASEIQKLIVRGQNQSFIGALQQAGISNSGNLATEIPQLSNKFRSLGPQQQQAFITQLGGARAIGALLPLLRDGAQLTDANAKSFQNGGAAAQEYGNLLHTLGGELRSIGGELKVLTTNIGKSGIFLPLAAGIELLKPGIQTINDLFAAIGKLDQALGHIPLVGGALSHTSEIAIGAGEVYLARRMLRRPNVQSVLSRGGTAADAEQTDAIAIETEATATNTAAIEARARALEADATAARVDTRAIMAETDALLAQTDAMLASGEASATRRSMGLGGGVGALTKDRALLGGLSLGEVGVAGLVGGAVYSSVHGAQTGIINAVNNVSQQGTGGNTADELNTTAENLSRAAQAAEHASGGFTASLVNFFEGNPTGAAASQARAEASYATTQATILTQVQSQNTGTPSGLGAQIDLGGSIDAITQNLTNLSDEGYSAGDVMAALTSRLQQFIASARQGANVLDAGQSQVLAANIGKGGGAELENFFNQFSAHSSIGLGSSPEYALKGVDFNQIAGGLTDTANTFFKQQGLTAGGKITPAQVQQLTQQEATSLRAHLAAQGKTSAQIAALSQDINLVAANTVRGQIAEFTGGKGVPLTDIEVGKLQQFYIQQAQSHGQSVAAQTSLAGGAGGVAGAQATLASLQSAYGTLAQNPGTTPDKLAQLQEAINQAQLQVQNAVTAHVQALAGLAQSLVSPWNKTGQIDAQIQGLQAVLATQTDADARAQTQAAINNAQNQLTQQTLTNQQSAIGTGIIQYGAGGTPVQNNVLDARVKLQQASNAYSFIANHGGTGADLTDAQTALFQAQLAYANAQIQDANDARDGQVAVGDKVGQAYAQYLDLLNTARTQTGGARLKTLQQAQAQILQTYLTANEVNSAVAQAQLRPQDTIGAARQKIGADRATLRTYQRFAPNDAEDIANAQKAIREDKLALQQALDQFRDDKELAHINPRASIALAREAVAAARRSVETDERGSDQYYKDLKSLHDAQVSLAQDIAQKEADAAVAAADPRSALSQAHAKVQADRDILSKDKRGSDQYYKDRATLKSDQFSLRQQHVDTANARIDAHTIPGNELSSAQAAIEKATNDLKLYKKGTTEYYEALAQLHQAQYDYANVIQQHNESLFALGGDVTDPVHMAMVALQVAQAKLAMDAAHHTGDIAQDELAVLQAQFAVQKAAFDQRNSIEQQMYQLHHISGAQYLQFLEAEQKSLEAQLAGMHKGSQGYEQTLEELLQVQSNIQSANEQLTGQFNVGSINTNGMVYQERRVAGLNGIDISGDSAGAGFGGTQDPASATMQPLVHALGAVQQPALAAAATVLTFTDALTALSAMSGGTGAAQSTTNNITLHGVPLQEILTYLQGALGSTAISSVAPIALRKVNA